MKMNNLFVGAILGLLAVVRSTRVNTVTEIPTKAEVDVLPETIMGELLDDYLLLPSLRVASPKKVTNTEAPLQPPSYSRESDVNEGNPAEKKVNSSSTSMFFQPSGDHHEIASQGVSQAQRPASTMVPGDTEDSSLDSSTTQSLQSASSVANKLQSRVTPDQISISQTTYLPVSGFDFQSTMSSDFGSGEGEMLGQYAAKSSTMTSSSRQEISTALLTSTAPSGNEDLDSGSGMSRLPKVHINLQSSELGSGDGTILDPATSSREETSTVLPTSTVPSVFRESEGSGMSGLSTVHTEFLSTLSTDIVRSQNRKKLGQDPTRNSGKENSITLISSKSSLIHPPEADESRNTSGWMTILACIIGVAAVAIIGAAIATRHKWRGPNHRSQLETKTDSSNQQTELDMEALLDKDKPRENGKASEYTVIPLDELPKSYSSH